MITAAAMGVSGAASAPVVGIGTSKQGGFTCSAGAATAKAVGAEGLRMLVRPYGGSGVYVPAVNKGEVRFALANALGTRYAVTGAGACQGRQQPNVRAVAVMPPPRVAIFTRKDSPIKTIADLKGKLAPGGLEPAYVMVYPYLVLTSSKVSDDMAYKVAKAMWGNRKGMIQAFRPMAGFSPKRMVAKLGPIRYHPGALRFYKEKGLWK